MLTSPTVLQSCPATVVRSPLTALPETAGPPAWGRVIRLSDGATLRLRPIRPDDELRLVDLFARLSPRTVYQRFFRAYDRLPAEWYQRFANVDYLTRLALVAEEQGAEGPLLRAVASYEPGETAGTAEIAIVVEDAWQGRGLGPVLLDALLATAEARGLRTFTADVLAQNRPMLRVISRLAAIRRRELNGDVLTIEFERRPVASQSEGR
jgi:RimJ/RimL family protein N-acetyltransferase